MTYAVCIIIGIIIARMFWRQLITAATWAVLLCVLYGFVRAAPSLGLSSGWLMASYGGGIVGFVVGAAVALRPIINFWAEANFRRAVERARQEADRQRV